MADIFISYSQKDRAAVAPLAATLEGAGWSVFWDPEIPTGEHWDRIIEKEIAEARVVLVVWTPTSSESRWVRTEADFGLEKTKLFPVTLLGGQPPLAHRLVQALDLSDWDGDPDSTLGRRLVSDLTRLQTASPSSAPAFAPEVSPSPPAAKGGWRMPTLILGAAGLLVGGGLLMFLKPDGVTPSSRAVPSPVEMAAIPEGYFLMGCSLFKLGCQEQTEKVFVSALTLDMTEVTVAAYRACVDSGACTEPGAGPGCNWAERAARSTHPVNCVDWHQAVAFCHQQGKRLPTEKEWERAARGGKIYLHPWGDEAANCDRAVLQEEEGAGCGRGSTWPVGSKPAGASIYGPLDMAGNVAEWTDTRFGQGRAVRGGAWDAGPDAARSTTRSSAPSGAQTSGVGFRCAKTAS